MRRLMCSLLQAAAVLVVLAAPAAALCEDAPLVSDKVRQLMQDRQYAEAVLAIDEAAGAKDAPADYLAYLKGRALYLQKEYDRAVETFQGLEKQFPESQWARRARFAKGLALARKGDFRGAELIYRSEAEHLLSEDRKQELADIYLEFADDYFKPPQQERKPDFAKALEFYQKALEMGPKAAKRIEVELLVAQCRQELGNLDEATKLYQKFIEDHPLEKTPLNVEARFRLGECRLAQGQLREARRCWQDLLAEAGDSTSERIAEAAFRLSRCWRIPQPQSDEELSLGVAALEAFLTRFPEHKLAGQAHLDIAQSYVHRGRFEDAVAALKRFLADPRYKDRQQVPDARNLLGRSYQLQKKFPEALAVWREYLTLHPAHKAWSSVERQIIQTEYLMAQEQYEKKKYDAARKLWDEFLAKYPLDERDPTILYLFGQMSYEQEKWPAAISEWRRLVSKYPESEAASQGQFMIAATLEQKEGKLEEALEEYRKLNWGSFAPRARQATARLTAKSMTIATQRVFRSDETPKIKLTTRNVEAVTVRAYKIDMETYFRKMQLGLGVENLDIALIDPDKTFEFKIPSYAKYQELESTLEVPLPRARGQGPGASKGGRGKGEGGKKEGERKTQTGDPQPSTLNSQLSSGVMAVTVASKTLEATTLVIQSDLDVIVKSSRDEVFVFAENMRTGEPWPAARLLISDGHEVLAEGVTGDDGVFQTKGTGDKEPAASSPAASGGAGTQDSPHPAPDSRLSTFNSRLKDAADVRVFAVSGGHTASNVVGLKGVGVARGLADKGYLYTDRPAYRAGQLVHLRGCIRRAALEKDAYVIDGGKQYTLEVFDSRNRLVRSEKVTLGECGTFSTHFQLPGTTPQGQCRVLVRDAENSSKTFQGTFQVHEYKLEPVRLVIDTPRRVYYRGEQIEGTIRAEFTYGAPLADREIRYQLADERLNTARTDEKGEVHFKLPTREFAETQILPLVVMLPERNLQTAANFILATQGFSIDVSTVRPVFVAGETFEVTVKANDAEGKPIGQKLTLSVLEKTTVDGKVGERLVEEHELATDKTDGAARQTLSVQSGGRYVLRVEGTDRFGNPISGEHPVQISDEKDKVRLRILADRHTYKVGDTAHVRLYWRERPGLALVTFQGARVLDYRLVRLAKGDNPLEIPVTARLAPNFELSAAVMIDPLGSGADRNTSPLPLGEEPGVRAAGTSRHPNPLPEAEGTVERFHSASSPFTVERDLNVSLTTKRKPGAKVPVRPGEEVEVIVSTTDPQGRPVAAEVSLAMVEASLLERFEWPVPAIEDFFRGEPRQPAVRTTASITFAYRPKTQAINPQLLAERERVEVAREEELSRELGVEPTAPAAADRPESDPFGVAAGEAAAPYGSAGGFGYVPAEHAARPDQNQNGVADQSLGTRVESLQMMVQPRVVVSEQSEIQLGGAMVSGLAGQSTRNGRQRRAQAGDEFSFYTGFSRSGGRAANGEMADFDSLIDLITSNNQPETWYDVSGPGSIAPSESNLSLVISQSQQVRRGVFVLDNKGAMQRLNLSGQMDRKRIEALAAELTASGAVLLPRLGPQETGYWNPAVETGKDGKATVTFAVPERSTAWKLLAKGITTDTLAGEADGELVVKKDLFGELKLPLAFTDGDQAELSVSVHNDAVDKGHIDVTLKTTIGDRTVEEKKTIDVTGKGIHELSFQAKLDRPASATGEEVSPEAEVNVAFELTVAAGDHSDAVRRTLPLLPYGMPVYATASGSATSDTTAWVETPREMPLAAPNLQILVGPTVGRSLLDIVLGPAPPCQIQLGQIASGLDTATSDLMASLALLGDTKLLGGRDSAGVQAQALDARVRSAVSLLISSQNDDGGWSWTGRGGQSNRYGTSRAVWALSLARAAGFYTQDANPVPPGAAGGLDANSQPSTPDPSGDCFAKALGYLRDQIAKIDHDDYESQAILLHALSAAGQGDFALANRLYRSRPALSSAALAHLALAFAAMDRKATAGELLDLLAKRNLDDAALRRNSPTGALSWSHSQAELHALYALGLMEVSSQRGESLSGLGPKAKEQVDWLLAHRTGYRWSPDKATGPAAMALCRWFARSRLNEEGQRYQLAVFVNDVRVKLLDVDPAVQQESEVIDVPAKLLHNGAEGKQRINFQLTGRGRYTYQCILGGFVPADKLKSTTVEWEVRRYHEPAPLEMDGREIPRGFGVLEGGYSSFRNPLTQLPVGRRGVVQLEVWRRNVSSNTPEEQLEYLAITEPIPSGTTVIEDSVKGGFERFEVAPGHITFYVGSRRYVGTIRYELRGYLPGKYRAGPTQIRNAYRPEQLAVCAPKPLEVLPLGAESSDPYRLTPQELYELGKRHFDKGQFEAARDHLTELVEKWNLKPEVYKDAVEKLLDVHLAIGPPAKIVYYFEIVKEKWPDLEIPFAKIVKVGAAYHEMGEYERSYLVFRATVESSFSRESGVAGFLDSQGEFLRSVDVMGRLLAEYPPEGYVAAATYALAQRVYAKAPEAAADPALRHEKVNRVDLVRRAWSMLESFLTAYPEDPAADQAAFASANALLELEAYPEAIAASNRYAKRYPESDLLDSFWYMIGYCHFATGDHQDALAMCRKVAEAQRIDKATGRRSESPNKWQAIYILGQVHHSLGQAAEAIREYRRVEDRFADAKEAIDYFLHKAIKLPEVTTVKPSEPVEVELAFRNIAACDVKVYRIDLMKFSLLKRNLGGITQINLAGIRPYHEATVKLGDGRDYRDRTHPLPLPLKEEGAYLVVCRGESLYASGLVLISPLAVDVQEEVASGRVRTTVKNQVADRYVDHVHVKVIGSRNREFVSGASDLRGVFVADGIQGTATVIAELEPSRYAFFRGQTDLGPPPPTSDLVMPQSQAAPAKPPVAKGQPAASLKSQLLENVQRSNSAFQQRQVEQLQQMYDKEEQGVQAKKAF